MVAVADDTVQPTIDPSYFQALDWRNIGPHRGGRVTAVAGVPDRPQTYYMGATGGGVWRTDDAGISWRNISDGFLATGSIGAIAVAPSDANVVWVGTGESPVRGVMTTHGDGVYRSTDDGHTFVHVGLEAARHIAEIRVHPHDPDEAWVAVQGELWGPSEERGIYHTRDGGATWTKVLYIDATTGASDLALDVTNPRVLYAGMWDHQRTPWRMRSGGPGSGVYKSTDGGANWEELTVGLPEDVMGKIGVAVSPVAPRRVWAMIEAEEGGLFRSDDAGATWRRVNDERVIRARSWYYTHVFADSQSADTVYVLNAPMMKSTDGGKTFRRVRTPHGDNHALWMAPEDNRRMINGNDGGANVSFNGGATWSTQSNQPTAQFYRVSVDNQFPYRVYGGQQDNSTLSLASRDLGSGLGESDWHAVSGCESAHIAFDPDHPELVYAGCYQGLISEWQRSTGVLRSIKTYPQWTLGIDPSAQRHRYNWNAPILVSRHDSSVIYHAANVVLRSTDRGHSWTEVSPDLTRDEEDKQGPGGGPITNEGAGGEIYGTILALAESPHDDAELWAGSDDGRVHVTRDGGATWQDVTPPGLDAAMINSIDLSVHAPGTAFLAVPRYKWADLAPHVFVTRDHGATWTRHTEGLPATSPVRVVREHPERADVLVAGTEHGVFVSVEGGAWQSLQLDLPAGVPITDLAIHHDDVVVATQGRSFWILDDISPLEELRANLAAPHLFTPRSIPVLVQTQGDGHWSDQAENPVDGVHLDYLLPADLDDTTTVRLEILDDRGQIVRRWPADDDESGDDEPPAADREARDGWFELGREPGHNRLVWDLRHAVPPIVDGLFVLGGIDGPRVPPGRYRARLTVGDEQRTVDFSIEPDPRLPDLDASAYRASYDEVLDIVAQLGELNDSVNRVRDAADQLGGWLDRVETLERDDLADLLEAGRDLAERLEGWEEGVVQAKNEGTQDIINFPPGIDIQYQMLIGQADSEPPPLTAGYFDLRADLDASWMEKATERDGLLGEVEAYNERIDAAGVAAILVPPASAFEPALEPVVDEKPTDEAPADEAAAEDVVER
ncbi:MAG: glycosyl hydrolase [Acidobacteriota bacterium]